MEKMNITKMVNSKGEEIDITQFEFSNINDMIFHLIKKVEDLELAIKKSKSK